MTEEELKDSWMDYNPEFGIYNLPEGDRIIGQLIKQNEELV